MSNVWSQSPAQRCALMDAPLERNEKTQVWGVDARLGFRISWLVVLLPTASISEHELGALYNGKWEI